jgi:site-specific recombinase
MTHFVPSCLVVQGLFPRLQFVDGFLQVDGVGVVFLHLSHEVALLLDLRSKGGEDFLHFGEKVLREFASLHRF